MRNMSFSLTAPQFIDGTKTVTRRLGWEFLEPGDNVMAVLKSMGLKKGEKVYPLGMFRVVHVRREQLYEMEADDLKREGFPEMTVASFIDMFCAHNGCKPSDFVTRIEFERVYE